MSTTAQDLPRSTHCEGRTEPNSKQRLSTSALNRSMNTPPTQTPPSSGIRSRSILERLRSPFGTRSRNLSDFCIEPSDPRRQYAPGDTLKGHVSLTVQKPTRVTHIVLGFHGFVKLYKNVVPSGRGTPSEVMTPAPGRGRRGPEYHGNGLMSLFDDEIVICGEGRLSPGRYSFDFEIAFPSHHLPTGLDVSAPERHQSFGLTFGSSLNAARYLTS